MKKPFLIDPNVLIDLTIAAYAMELGATLVTTDRHFDNIPNLDILYAGPEEIPSTPNH